MNRIKELESEILKHKALYYQGRPEIPDHQYDVIEEELKKLDPENFALSLVGTEEGGSDKIEHQKKMLSLNKVYSIEELDKWREGRDILSTFKLDGVSCSLIYKDGNLVLGKTRGNGQIGENITNKVSWMSSIPYSVESKYDQFEVRGELFCTEESFFKLSEEMEKLGLERPSSQRNIVAGLLGRKGNLELSRYIQFQAFELISEELSLNFEADKLKSLKQFGFDIPEYQVHKDIKTIEKTIKDTEIYMAEGDIQIDGVVFSFNDLELHKTLGETAHHPRYKMAFKYKGISKEATIDEISWQVSRNGTLTPVGNIIPIELSGAKISRVTLHNYGLVKQHNLKKGDKIEIIRSGEVIPKFLQVIDSSDEEFSVPESCPSCGEKIHKVDIRLKCVNPKCPAVVKESILNFIQKIGIDDLSSKRLDELLRVKMVSSIPDLYKLKEEDFLKLDKVKEKLAKKFYNSISASKKVNFVTFLSALGLQGGAYNKCEKVVKAGYDTVEKVKGLTVDKLSEVDSFAEKSSIELLKSFKERVDIVDELVGLGFSFENSSSEDKALSGKKICITGTLSEKRSVIESKIREAGGTMSSSVTKNLDFLVSNDLDSKSSKCKKAKDLGIEIISEEKLFSLF